MTAPVRNNDLAQIHMAKAALSLDDGAYRALLSERYGVITAAALGPAQRQDLLGEFERRGWKRGFGRGPAGRVEARGKDTPSLAKVRALLAEGGKTAEYGDALAKRIAKVDRLEWCTPEQIGKVIAALEYDARRKAAKVLDLPPSLLHLLRERPDLDGRVRGMVAGALRNPRNTIDSAAEWVLATLRKEAEARAAEGAARRTPYRSDRQYARDKAAEEHAGPRRDREFLDALTLIGLIDRIRLEVGNVR